MTRQLDQGQYILVVVTWVINLTITSFDLSKLLYKSVGIQPIKPLSVLLLSPFPTTISSPMQYSHLPYCLKSKI